MVSGAPSRVRVGPSLGFCLCFYAPPCFSLQSLSLSHPFCLLTSFSNSLRLPLFFLISFFFLSESLCLSLPQRLPLVCVSLLSLSLLFRSLALPLHLCLSLCMFLSDFSSSSYSLSLSLPSSSLPAFLSLSLLSLSLSSLCVSVSLPLSTTSPHPSPPPPAGFAAVSWRRNNLAAAARAPPSSRSLRSGAKEKGAGLRAPELRLGDRARLKEGEFRGVGSALERG